jgi:proteasome lid subunit RPN8/RPN11
LGIKIEGEIKKEIHEMEPPKHIQFEYMPGLDTESSIHDFIQSNFKDFLIDNTLLTIQSKEKVVQTHASTDLDLYLNDFVFKKMYMHCSEMALKNLEAMGFLIGELRRWSGKGFSIVHDVVTSDLDSTNVSVRFHRDSFEKLFNQLDQIAYDYVIIGWYHSHLGYESFMSSVDIQTQKKYFNKPFHAAIVIDPINLEIKSFRYKHEQCIEIPYAIFNETKE